jgi:hypothetical protein
MRLHAFTAALLAVAGCAGHESQSTDIDWATPTAPRECPPPDWTTGAVLIYAEVVHMFGEAPARGAILNMTPGVDPDHLGPVLAMAVTDDRGCATFVPTGAGDYSFSAEPESACGPVGDAHFHWNGTWLPQVKLVVGFPCE